MPHDLTRAQRCVLADCVRVSLVGWLVTDPAVDRKARRLEARATGVLGFGFSRFVAMAMTEFGAGYRPHSALDGTRFPLSLQETAALANDIELDMAGEDQIAAAGLIAAHSPYGRPEAGSRDWWTYLGLLDVLGLAAGTDAGDWHALVRERLRPFRHAVSGPAVAE